MFTIKFFFTALVMGEKMSPVTGIAHVGVPMCWQAGHGPRAQSSAADSSLDRGKLVHWDRAERLQKGPKCTDVALPSAQLRVARAFALICTTFFPASRVMI